jgi:hypothetical protein
MSSSSSEEDAGSEKNILYFNEEEKQTVDDINLMKLKTQGNYEYKKGEDVKTGGIFDEHPTSFRQSRADNRAHLSKLHIDKEIKLKEGVWLVDEGPEGKIKEGVPHVTPFRTDENLKVNKIDSKAALRRL